jgi:hypothetical protein
MNRRSNLWFALAALAVALCVGTFVGAPDLEAAPPWYCSTYINSPVDWGNGADCAAATANLNAQLNAYADDYCFPDGTSSRQIIITTACHGSNPVMVDGYIRFRCRAYLYP